MASTVAKSVRLDADIDARLESLAQAKDRAPHYLMRQAIQEYVEREEKRMAFISEGRAAWENYQRTGEHLTMDEFSTLVAELKARQGGKNAPE